MDPSYPILGNKLYTYSKHVVISSYPKLHPMSQWAWAMFVKTVGAIELLYIKNNVHIPFYPRRDNRGI
jgi:hypothetical protein